MASQAKARIDGLRTVGIPVSDQDRALAFYIDTLGFEKIIDMPLEQLGGRWIELRPAQSATTIAVIPSRDDVSVGVDTGIRFTTDDAAALHTELSDRGVDVDELLHWEGAPPMFDFRDPDGNVLYVSEVPKPPA
jgi:lactoylglutathione lyase